MGCSIATCIPAHELPTQIQAHAAAAALPSCESSSFIVASAAGAGAHGTSV
jgi:hypothetical protein